MELKIVLANPAGNITAFVLDDVNRRDYIDISHKLMNIKEFGIEQVAFIKSLYEQPYTMEMMGLEFCGNASRCFGYLVKKYNNINSNIIRVKGYVISES
jgi:diaminopimelate epimerase